MELGAHMGWFLMRWPREVREHLVRTAEEIRYDSIWTAESTGCDGATPLAMAATLTERVRIGAGVCQMPGRSAAATAMIAVSLDRLSDGRFLLGIGASTKNVTEDWHGTSFARQLARTREYVSVLRALLEGEPKDSDSGLTDRPIQDRIPILIGAIGPRNVALCGEIADGRISTMIPPERIRDDMVRVHEAADEANWTLPEDFHVVLHAMTSIDEDPVVARDRLRPMLTVYAGMGKPDRNLYRRLYDGLGFQDELEVVTDHY